MTWFQFLASWLLFGTFFALFSAESCAIFSNVGKTGDVEIEITDAPADDVERLRLAINRVEFGRDNGDEESRNTDLVIENLLDLQQGETRTLLDDELPAGSYDWLRLHLNLGDSEVEERDGGVFSLETTTVTDGEAVLRVDQSFKVEDDETKRLVLDVELRQALVVDAAGYLMRPVLRLMDRGETGSLEGTVAATLVNDDDCINDLSADEGRGLGNVLYLYEGEDRVPGDMDLDSNGIPLGANNPLSVAPARQEVGEDDYQYRFGFLPEGDYTLAFTCQGMADFPDESNDIEFSPVMNVRIDAGATTEQDLD